MSDTDMKVLIIPVEESCNRIDLFCILYVTSEDFFFFFLVNLYSFPVFYQNMFFYQQTEFSVSLNPPIV